MRTIECSEKMVIFRNSAIQSVYLRYSVKIVLL